VDERCKLPTLPKALESEYFFLFLSSRGFATNTARDQDFVYLKASVSAFFGKARNMIVAINNGIVFSFQPVEQIKLKLSVKTTARVVGKRICVRGIDKI
jgi:hypothetical protein